MPGNPHDCRDHAKDCLRLAHEATTPEAKTHFEKLAHQWMELATDLDDGAALGKRGADRGQRPSRPTVLEKGAPAKFGA